MNNHKTFYNKDIINFIKRKTGFSKKKTSIAFSAIKECIIDVLSQGDSVALKSFGSFVVRTQKVPLYFGASELRDKKVARFLKSKSWHLPAPKQKKSKSARNIEKRILPPSLAKRNINCDYDLIDYYRRVVSNRTDCLPYVWKLKISKENYNELKGLLSWALEEYDERGLEYRNLLKKHANLFAIYIAEWYKREYNNIRGDESNDALRSLDLPASTNDYTIIWQYSSPAFNIDHFLYGSKRTNRIKHSLYVLGGIPLQFEFKKLRAIIFNSIACSKQNQQNFKDDNFDGDEFDEDQAFLVENLYLHESLKRKDGSLHLFVNELKNGTYLEDFQNDDDFDLFVENYYNLSQRFFCKNKFNCEWLLRYKDGDDMLNRELMISLNNEYSNDNDKFYISTYRLKKWNIPLEELYEFDIILKYNEQTKKLFRFSCVDENSYVSEKHIKRILIPSDFHEGYMFLRNIETNEEYLLTEKAIKFDDVKRFFKTSAQYEWTDNPHLNTTDVAILCTDLYTSDDFQPLATLRLGEGTDTIKYHWIPFKNEITIINTRTGEEQKYLGKTGRLIINLFQNYRGTLHKVIPYMTVLCRKEDSFERVKIFRKNQEGYLKDKFVFEEYDQHRGILISRQLDKEKDVKITIIQNDKEYDYPIGLNLLDYGLFTVNCEKQNHKCSYKAFCLNDSNDVFRDFDNCTFNFSKMLCKFLGGIIPLNTKIESQSIGVFKENLLVDCGSDTMFFCSNDDKIRIPVYRVSRKTYVIFVNGKPELTKHKKGVSIPTLYVSKQKQECITGINVIDENGVYGISKENVRFVNYQLQTVFPNAFGIYKFNIPQKAQGKYEFARYNFGNSSLICTYSEFKKGNSCSIPSDKNEVVVQTINPDNEPDYRFLFLTPVSLHVNSQNLSQWFINSCNNDLYFNCLADESGTNCFEWTLARNEDCNQEIKRLASFLNCLLDKTDYSLSDKVCEHLNFMAYELGFCWMFLYPKMWSTIINVNRKDKETLMDILDKHANNNEISTGIKAQLSELEKKDKNIKNSLLKILIYPHPNNKYVREISEALLNGVFENLDSSIWVNHRRFLGNAKRSNSKDYRSALAVDYLMPKVVKKMQTGRKSDPNDLRELYFDINNRNIERQYSFTGQLYDSEIANELLEYLSHEESYKEICEYMHRLNFI